jgi:hypothetical protein
MQSGSFECRRSQAPTSRLISISVGEKEVAKIGNVVIFERPGKAGKLVEDSGVLSDYIGDSGKLSGKLYDFDTPPTASTSTHTASARKQARINAAIRARVCTSPKFKEKGGRWVWS